MDEAPDLDPSWEDVVEVSTAIPRGCRVRWMAWALESGGVLPRIEAGPFRVRVSARGRDAGSEAGEEEGLVDAYLVQIWPAPACPDAILEVGSEDARYWHRTVGSRR